jgi:hypothetical protein
MKIFFDKEGLCIIFYALCLGVLIGFVFDFLVSAILVLVFLVFMFSLKVRKKHKICVI